MNTKTKNCLKKTAGLCSALLLTFSGAVVANSGYIEDQFSGEIPIDIDGSFSKPSQSSKLEQVRKKLERQNEEMVQKKIEDIRVDNETKLTKQLESALNGNAPLSSSTPVSASEQVNSGSIDQEKLIDIGLNFGVSNINGTAIDLETSLNGKLTIDSKLSKNIILGLGIGYTNVAMVPLTDVFGSSYYSAYYGSGNYNVTGNFGQAIEYDQLDISANGKFLIGKSRKLTPYIGLGLVYSRFNIASNNNMNSFWNNGLNQNMSVDGSFMSLNANLGARLMFSELVGMSLELGYTRGVGGILGNQNTLSLLNPNSIILNDIANEISESNIFGIQAGLLFSF